MEDDDIIPENYAPWVPMIDPASVKALGKLAEEAGELVAVASRCIIQGIDEKIPESDKTNRDWLEQELADIFANAEIVCEHFALNYDRINSRMSKKKRLLERWLQQTNRR